MRTAASTSFARSLPFFRRLPTLAAVAAVVLATACGSLPPQPPAQFAQVSAAPAASSSFSPELQTVRLREAAFDRAWNIVDERFYDVGFNGVDWDDVRLKYLPQLGDVDSDDTFYALLNKMVGELQDSHTRVYTPREYRNRLDSVISTYGLRVAEVDGQVAIVQILPDTDAARAGLRPGMIIETINGEKAIARLARLRADAPPDVSTARRLRAIFSRLIIGRANKLAIDVRAGEATSRYDLQRAEREIPLRLTHSVLDGNVGYIAFNRFRPETAADFGGALARLIGTDALIVDLRGNPGGSLGSMLSIAQSFFPESRHVLTRRLRPVPSHGPESDGLPSGRPASPEMRILGNASAYTQPLAVLMDNYAASSSELLAAVLREQRGALIVGRPSCGCVVAVRPNGYKLPAGGALYVAESGFVTAQGHRLEGVPLQPDREVPLSLADLKDGIDRDVVAAMALLRQQRTPPRTAEEQ